MKILNLYAGVGGNRKDWPSWAQVTAIEMNPKIAAVYRRLYPNDIVIEGDAHEYLREHSCEFDFIWSSPPCQSHTRMMKFTRHKHLRKYPDLKLYEEILFLRHFSSGPWVVENVVPYYDPIIPATKKLGRHLFWANFDFEDFDVKRPNDFINLANLKGKKALMDWLGIHFKENIYYEGNHCPAQILRNCVHPKLGAHILDAAITAKKCPK